MSIIGAAAAGAVGQRLGAREGEVLAHLVGIHRMLEQIHGAVAFYQRPLSVLPMVKAFSAVDTPELLVPANPQRVKLIVAHLVGAGNAFLAARREALIDAGFPLSATRPPFVDDWPWVHRDEWYAQVDTAPLSLLVIEYTLQP